MSDSSGSGPEKGSLAQSLGPEKASGRKGHPSDESDIPQHGTALTKVYTSISRRSRRRDSNASYDRNPLEPLERALTPEFETVYEREAREPVSHVRTATSFGSSASRHPDFEVVFEEDDVENPRSWSKVYRYYVLLGTSFSAWTVVFNSTSYTASIKGLMDYFHEPNEIIITLGLTTYLFGLAVGCVLVAPLSELFGRRPIYVLSTVCFTLLAIPCARATSLAEIIVVRFFAALFGSALISNSPATAMDISNEENRAFYMSLVLIAPVNGPVTGPVIGGLVYEYLGWRWNSWLVLILGGAACIIMFTVKETYGPVILKAKAARRRKETDDDRYWCRYDQKIDFWPLLKLNLSRPFILSFTEPILWFFNIWLSITYSILYLCFVAYPIVFAEHRGWSSALSGLAFIGIGIGTLMAIFSEKLCRWLINKHPKDPETGRAPPEASARVMIIGTVLTAIGQLVFSWTCLPATIHWAVPISFGIFFGCGNTLTFIYSSNYLAGSYGIFAASALAGNAVMRSAFGGTLPLAGPKMYHAMTPQWAGTLLGLLEACLIPIPIVFFRYGERIRAKSRVIRRMREDIEIDEKKRADKEAKLKAKKEKEAAARRADAETGVVGSIRGSEDDYDDGHLHEQLDEHAAEHPALPSQDLEKAAAGTV